MKYEKVPPFSSRRADKRLLPVLWFLVALIIALLSGLFLFRHRISDEVTNGIINIGLDVQRAQLIAALLLTAGAALCGAALARRKFGAVIGGGIIFLARYLITFIQQQTQIVRDPSGLPEPLSTSTLIHNSFILLALGLLSAFIGSAVGDAISETLLDPPYRFTRFLWQRYQTRNQAQRTVIQPRRVWSWQTISGWTAAISMLALIILASNSTDVFIFSPDVGIHTKPELKDTTGRIIAGTIIPDTLISPAMGNQRKAFVVYLPPSYNTPEGRNKHYPTLYLLHGSPGKDIDWVTGGKANESADELIAAKEIPELIMILPDGNGRPGATSEWGNSGDQKQLIETYVANNLVKYVDQHYRTIPDAMHRAIGGLSMGGFGATNIAIHHPEVFGNVISLGGYYKAEGTIWGKDPAYRQYNSPLLAIPFSEQAWKLHFFLGSATKDQPYYNDTKQLMKELDKLNIKYHFDLEPGYHAWKIWQDQMFHALQWLQWDALNPPKP